MTRLAVSLVLFATIVGLGALAGGWLYDRLAVVIEPPPRSMARPVRRRRKR